jgi:hypothetical protein
VCVCVCWGGGGGGGGRVGTLFITVGAKFSPNDVNCADIFYQDCSFHLVVAVVTKSFFNDVKLSGCISSFVCCM